MRDQPASIGGCTAVRGPGDNPEMESSLGRFKLENRSLILDVESLEELNIVARDRITYYSRRCRHSSLGGRPPLAIIKDFCEGRIAQSTPEVRCPTLGGSLDGLSTRMGHRETYPKSELHPERVSDYDQTDQP